MVVAQQRVQDAVGKEVKNMGVTVSLNNRELIWIESIVLDDDKDEALKFAKVIKAKIEQQEQHKCGPRI